MVEVTVSAIYIIPGVQVSMQQTSTSCPHQSASPLPVWFSLTQSDPMGYVPSGLFLLLGTPPNLVVLPNVRKDILFYV